MTGGDEMPRVIVAAEVNNLEAWEKSFRTHGDLFKQMGVATMEYATGQGNRVAVCGETNDLDAYVKVLKLAGDARRHGSRRREAGNGAGVRSRQGAQRLALRIRTKRFPPKTCSPTSRRFP
jgi:hypothetical protein